MSFTKENYEELSEKYTQTGYCIHVPNSNAAKVAYADEDGTLYVTHLFKGCRKSRMIPVADFFANVRF